MRKSSLPYPNGLQDSRVAELFQYFRRIEVLRRARVVRFETSHELRRAAHHLLQQLHQRVAEVRGHGLLRAGLRRQASAVEALLDILVLMSQNSSNYLHICEYTIN